MQNTNTNTVVSSCGVKGCEHNSLRGKGSVTNAVWELTLVREGLKEVCDRRKRFLEDKVVNFMNFLMKENNKTKEEARASVLMMNRSVLRHLEEKEKENMMEDTDGKLVCRAVSFEDRLLDELEQAPKMEGMMHRVAYTAWCKEVKSGKEAMEKFEEACSFLEMLEQASEYALNIHGPLTVDVLEKHNVDKEYWKLFLKYFSDGFSEERVVKMAFKARARACSLRYNLKMVTHEMWAYLYNWCNNIIGLDKQYGEQQELWEAIHAEKEEDDTFENAQVIERTVSAE